MKQTLKVAYHTSMIWIVVLSAISFYAQYTNKMVMPWQYAAYIDETPRTLDEVITANKGM